MGWTEDETVLASTDIKIKVRTCENASCSAEITSKPWNTCTTFNREDKDLTNISSASSCVTNSDQYVQYQAILLTTDTDITPLLNEVKFGLTSYPTNTGTLIDFGYLRDDTWAWTVGGQIYISVTATTGNTLTQTAPSGAGDQVVVIGVATHADRMKMYPGPHVLVDVPA